MFGAEPHEGVGHNRRPIRLGNADYLAPHTRRICERPDEIHQRGGTQLPPHGAHVLHRRVEVGCEQEDHSRFVQHTRSRRRIEHDPDAERLEHVR